MEKYIELSDLQGNDLGRLIIKRNGELAVKAKSEEAKVMLNKISEEISGKELRLRYAAVVGDGTGKKEVFLGKAVNKEDEDYIYAVLKELRKYDVRVKKIKNDLKRKAFLLTVVV